MGQSGHWYAPCADATGFDCRFVGLRVPGRGADAEQTEYCTALGKQVCANRAAIRFGAERDVSSLQPALANARGVSFTAPRKQNRDALSPAHYGAMVRSRCRLS